MAVNFPGPTDVAMNAGANTILLSQKQDAVSDIGSLTTSLVGAGTL